MSRRKCSWEQDYARRLRFERAAYTVYPGLRSTQVGQRKYARIAYTVTVPVNGYEARIIEIRFRRTTTKPSLDRIYADGPAESPHRFAPHAKDPLRRSSLCIWDDDDPPERRWIPSDGLLSLIEMTRMHLFKEAYWRETGEWLGEEAPHDRRPLSKAC